MIDSLIRPRVEPIMDGLAGKVAQSGLTANKLTADGAEAMIAEMKEQKAEWLYLPPDSYLGTQAQKVIIPAASRFDSSYSTNVSSTPPSGATDAAQ